MPTLEARVILLLLAMLPGQSARRLEEAAMPQLQLGHFGKQRERARERLVPHGVAMLLWSAIHDWQTVLSPQTVLRAETPTLAETFYIKNEKIIENQLL